MPKIPVSFTQFERGENTATDPRDLGKGYLAGCVNMMVDEVGIIRTIGATESHDSQGATGQTTSAIGNGTGLFAFSHDRLGGANSDNMVGTHTGGAAEAILTDSSGAFIIDSLIGAIVTNTTNNESATITDNNATTVTGALSSGETWDNGDTYTITGFPETSDDYLVIADTDTSAYCRIWSKENDAWGADTVIDLGSTTGMKPTFHTFDGGLRVSDGNFGAANKTKWYGYVDRQKFWTAENTPTYTDNNWFSLDNDLAPPPIGTFTNYALPIVSQHDGGDGQATVMTDSGASFTSSQLVGGTIFNLTDGSSGVITANDGTTVTVTALAGGTDNDWDDNDYYKVTHVPSFTGALNKAAGWFNVALHSLEDSRRPEAEWQKHWECGVSYVYDTTQETLISVLSGTVDLSESTDVSSAQFEMQFVSEAADRCNARLTHAKVYIREVGTQPWLIQGVWDLQNGGRLINGDTYDYWIVVDTTTDYNRAFNVLNTQPIPQILHTWETETGIFSDEKSIDIGQTGDGYNASVVIGRTVYVGNVKRTNFDGESLIEADAIYKSIPDQPDCFPASWRIDAAINDGEGITALHKWGKELLQFKHRTLYIIDTSGDVEVLTNTFKKAGARNPAIITDTPHGIIWANEWGLWKYDGQLTNLLVQDTLGNRFFEQEVQTGQFVTIEQSVWSTFINSNSLLGYYAYKQQIIIVDDATSSSDGDIYIYDIRTGSIVRGLAIFSGNGKTNFVTDSNDDLVIAHTSGTIVKWGDTELATTLQQVDFPEIGTLGKLFRTKECSVHYKSSAAQATPLYYRLNGGSSWTAFGTQSMADTGDGTSEGWTRLVFVHGSFLEGETIQLKLDFPSSGIVQINDVTLSVRLLSAKRVS